MRKYLYTAAVAALALALVAPANAQEAKAKKAAPHEFTGMIDKIDGMSVTLKKGEETKVVVCDEKTKIKTADKKDGATLADLKTGDKVLAKYVEQDGKNVAKSIAPPDAPKKGKKKQAAE